MQSQSKSGNRVVFSRLGRRFAILIVLFSSCFTLLSTTLQLALDYRTEINRIEQQFNNIRTSYVQAITLSVWSIDDSQIQTQLVGLTQLPDIEYAAIEVEGTPLWEHGVLISNVSQTERYPLIFKLNGRPDENIGALVVTASIENVYQRLINKAWVILISNGIKTFLVSGFILILVWRLITLHLKTISDHLDGLSIDNLTTPLKLDSSRKSDKKDEIDYVADSINQMCQSLQRSYDDLNQAHTSLQKLVEERDDLLVKEQNYKENLELLVSERTEQLEQSLQELKSAQQMLVESEKMAALGNMVAGVAHEINTPIGVCRTAASFQGDSSQLIKGKLKDGTLTQSDLETFLKDIDESSEIFEANIIKASELIASFKLIATDQSDDIPHRFNLSEYLAASIQTIYPQFKHRNVSFKLDIPEDIKLYSYPGAFHQIISNLINNSIIHGFENKPGGNINIAAETEADLLTLHYRDDGRGLTEEEKNKLFEPFFTSKRGYGGSGLGMSIVYNLITHNLKGSAKVVMDEQPGFHLMIQIPLEKEDSVTA